LDSGCSSSVLAAIDRMGVMPEPAAKPTRWMARCFLTTKRPSGGITWIVAGLEGLGRPVGEQAASTGRMPISSSPAGQAAARAADRVAAAHVLAVDVARRVRNWPGSKAKVSRSVAGMAKVMATAPAASGLTRLTVSS
jgi:hypothetical protein